MDYFLLLPELILAGGVVAIILTDLLVTKSRRRLALFSLAGLTFLVYLAGTSALLGLSQSGFNGHFLVDQWSTFFKLLFGFAGLALILLSYEYLDQRNLPAGEYLALLLGSFLGLSLLLGVGNLLTLYISLELVSLTSYLLAAFLRDNPYSTEAGLKYFLVGSVMSAVMLFGISLLYGASGSLNLQVLAATVSPGEILSIAGIILFLSGLLFKIAAVPFQVWAPDALQGAPTPITTFFSVSVKLGVLALLGRIFTYFSGTGGADISYYFTLIAVTSMVLGNLAALKQSNLKRMMAYSSIAHVGYLLIAFVLGTQGAYLAFRIYAVVYLAAVLGIFAIILWVENQGRGQDIQSLQGLGRTQPLLGLALGVFVLSLIGIPPTGGFIGKLLLFMASVQEQEFLLAIFMVLNGVISVVYYYKMLSSAFFKEDKFDPVSQKSRSLSTVVAAAVVVILLTGIWPGWL